MVGTFCATLLAQQPVILVIFFFVLLKLCIYSAVSGIRMSTVLSQTIRIQTRIGEVSN